MMCDVHHTTSVGVIARKPGGAEDTAESLDDSGKTA
jgi:hypothetical protein